MFSGIFALLYVRFFWNDLLLNPILFNIGLGIYAVINSLNDFYLGRLSDKTDVARWGSRRLIYIKWGGIVWAIIFFVMWFPWSTDHTTPIGQLLIFLHFITSICALDTFVTLVWLLWVALLPELTESTEERTEISLLTKWFLMFGSIPVLLAFLIYDMGLIYFQIFTGICAIFGGCIYFYVGSKMRERPELYVAQEILPLKQSLKEVLESKTFVTVTIFRSFNVIYTSLGAEFVFAFIFIMKFDSQTTSLLFFLIYTLVSFLGNLLYHKLSLKTDMRTLIIRGRIINIILNIIGFFVILIDSLWFFIWIFLAVNFFVGGYGLFDYPVLMLISDDDERTHGQRREGLIVGTNAFFMKIADSAGPILGTTVLLLFGFVRDFPTQIPEAIFGIKILFFIVPAIVHFIGLIAMYYFPLHGEELKKLNSQLLELHKQKTEAYKPK
ncbi:MAG: MFS transporter [archaeon]|nr:MFS transporter [archaeon]